jgi:hypothetical protein
MPQICIPTPPLDEIRTVDLEVTIDGTPQKVQYRVETLDWPADADARLAALRSFISGRASEWLLVQIGTPTDERVPLLFRLRAPAGPPDPSPTAPPAQP